MVYARALTRKCPKCGADVVRFGWKWYEGKKHKQYQCKDNGHTFIDKKHILPETVLADIKAEQSSK